MGVCEAGVGHDIGRGWVGLRSTKARSSRLSLTPHDRKSVRDSCQREQDFLFSLQISENNRILYLIDAEDIKTSNWMRYVNCSRGRHEENLEAIQCSRGIYYKTRKTIKPGQELLVYYGDKFARALRLPVVGGEAGFQQGARWGGGWLGPAVQVWQEERLFVHLVHPRCAQKYFRALVH